MTKLHMNRLIGLLPSYLRKHDNVKSEGRKMSQLTRNANPSSNFGTATATSMIFTVGIAAKAKGSLARIHEDSGVVEVFNTKRRHGLGGILGEGSIGTVLSLSVEIMDISTKTLEPAVGGCMVKVFIFCSAICRDS